MPNSIKNLYVFRFLMLLILAGNICQSAYGFSLNSAYSLFSTIKDSISSYSSPLLETFNEYKTTGYTLAALGVITFSTYFLRKSSHKKNKVKSKNKGQETSVELFSIKHKKGTIVASMKLADYNDLKRAIDKDDKPMNEEELQLYYLAYLLIRGDKMVDGYISSLDKQEVQHPKTKSSNSARKKV